MNVRPDARTRFARTISEVCEVLERQRLQ
jgi:hypothetical protein